MFILVDANLGTDLVRVYDTKDNTVDEIRLSILANYIHKNKFSIKGINTQNKGSYLKDYDLSIDSQEARSALIKHLHDLGYNKNQISQFVGC